MCLPRSYIQSAAHGHQPEHENPGANHVLPNTIGPIISTVAQAAVMETMGHFATSAFMVPKIPEPLRHAIVCVFKATVAQAT
jgi:hypothetical protein